MCGVAVAGDATFFQNGYQSDFGKFFLKWYSDAALQLFFASKTHEAHKKGE